jgi:hypothetical protein
VVSLIEYEEEFTSASQENSIHGGKQAEWTRHRRAALCPVDEE